MNRIVLQIPVNSDLKERAELAAQQAGFSSVQEVVRVFLNRLANQSVEIAFYDKSIRLSPKAEKRYSEMIKDVKKKKNIVKTSSFDDLISVLE